MINQYPKISEIAVATYMECYTWIDQLRPVETKTELKKILFILKRYKKLQKEDKYV